MLERGNLIFVEGAADRDRKVARERQHEAAVVRTRLHGARPGGLEPLGSKSIFTAHGCDIKTLTSPGLTNQAGQSDSRANATALDYVHTKISTVTIATGGPVTSPIRDIRKSALPSLSPDQDRSSKMPTSAHL